MGIQVSVTFSGFQLSCLPQAGAGMTETVGMIEKIGAYELHIDICGRDDRKMQTTTLKRMQLNKRNWDYTHTDGRQYVYRGTPDPLRVG